MAVAAAAASPRRPLSRRVSEPLSVIHSINSLLHSLNPPNPKYHQIPNPAVLNQFSAYLTPALVIEVVKNQTNPYHALFFFNWASNPIPNPKNYRHSHFCYVAIADKLLSHNLFSLATDLLESRRKFTDSMVGKFIKAHGDLGHLKWCVALFLNQVRRNEIDGCLYSFNSLLGVLVKANRVSHAWGYFGNIVIKSSIVIPDASSYTVMMGGLCKVGMVDYAEKLFDEMTCGKKMITYNTIISGLCKNGFVERAHRIVERMGGDDGCYPEVRTYTALIDGYCKKGEVYAALRCFNEMASNGKCEPNVVTYNALIHGMCLHGHVDGAKKLLIRMRMEGLKDDIMTHTSFLNAYFIDEKYHEAIEHFNEMITPERSIIPRSDNCNVILQSLVKLHQFDKAIHLLKEMPGWGCRPSFKAYKEVIMGLVEKGRIQDADTVVDDMIRDRHAPDTELYSSLIEMNFVNGNIEKAIALFEAMIGEGYLMKGESIEAFVRELCSRGLVNEVENLFDLMKKNCSGFDVVTYQSVLNEYLSARDESRHLLKQFLSRQHKTKL